MIRCNVLPIILPFCSTSYDFGRCLFDNSFQHLKVAFASVGKNLLLRSFVFYPRLDAYSSISGGVDNLEHYLGSFDSETFASGEDCLNFLGKRSPVSLTVRWRLMIAAYILFLVSWTNFSFYAFRYRKDRFLFVKFIFSFGLPIMRKVLLYNFAECE
jgi:hypothetical protein